MLRPEDIEAIAKHNPAAREILRAVEVRLARLLKRKGGDPVQEQLRETALEVVAEVAGHKPEEGHSPPWPPPRYRLPSERKGVTGRLAMTDGEQEVKLYTTLSFYREGSPSELFVRKQADATTVGALLDALATVVSIALQHGIPWEVMAGKMTHTRFPPFGMTEEEDPNLKFVSSVLDYVFRWADRAIKRQGERP